MVGSEGSIIHHNQVAKTSSYPPNGLYHNQPLATFCSILYYISITIANSAYYYNRWTFFCIDLELIVANKITTAVSSGGERSSIYEAKQSRGDFFTAGDNDSNTCC